MVLSVPVIALGATLGTATSILALCGVTCLCRHMHPKKGLLQRDRDPDPEKARPGVLQPAQQVSGRRLGLPGRGGVSRCSGWDLGCGSRRGGSALRRRAGQGGGRRTWMRGPSRAGGGRAW